MRIKKGRGSLISVFRESFSVHQVRGWSGIGRTARTARGIFTFPENYQNLRIIIGNIFKINYGGKI